MEQHQQHPRAAHRRRPRVLCLHSWRTSAAIFREQLARAKLLPELEARCDLTFVDAPHAARGRAPRDVREAFPARDYYEWFTTEGAEEDVENFTLTYEGLDASEAFLARAIAERGPLDGLLGFSQGAVMAAAMVALQRAASGGGGSGGGGGGGGGANEALARAPPIKFAAFFGAAFSRHPRHAAAFAQGPFAVPTLHVIGHKDFVKPHSIELVRQFVAPIVVFHPRGHVIPRLEGPHLAVLRAFFGAVGGGGGGGGSIVGGVGGGSGLREEEEGRGDERHAGARSKL